jgi:hypothetical protein
MVAKTGKRPLEPGFPFIQADSIVIIDIGGNNVKFVNVHHKIRHCLNSSRPKSCGRHKSFMPHKTAVALRIFRADCFAWITGVFHRSRVERVETVQVDDAGPDATSAGPPRQSGPAAAGVP